MSKYDLSGYQQGRQAIQEQNDALTAQYNADAAAWDQRTAQDMLILGKDFEHPLEDDPEPPMLTELPPDIPPSFQPSLMPELSEAGDFPTAMAAIEESTRRMRDHLKDVRALREDQWTRIEAAYNMDDGMKVDTLRQASTIVNDDDKSDMEKNRARLGACLPLTFEACEYVKSRLYANIRGSGAEYVDIKGREKNDIPDAKRAVAFLNYQYGSEIRTNQVLLDCITDATKLGTGFLLQSWRDNKRVMESISPWMLWIDNAETIDACSYAIVRRIATVAELQRLRSQGVIYFTDADMESAANSQVKYEGPDTIYGGKTSRQLQEYSYATQNQKDIDYRYRKVVVDTCMDTANGRWITMVNEDLIVAIQPSILPNRLPITVIAPLRVPRELYGDSGVMRVLDSQDLCNALFEIMIANANISANPAWLTNDSSVNKERPKAGYLYNVNDPSSLRPLTVPNAAQQIFYSIDWIRQNAIDRASGINDTMRGQAQYAGMTATATSQLSMQAGNRIAPQEDMILDAARDMNTVALALNRLYLQPHQAFRVLGEVWMPEQGMVQGQRPIQGTDLFGIEGVDLVPTGSPGTQVGMAQEYLNAATVIMQMGGNPQPIMREYTRSVFDGRINVDEIWPENHVGNDAMDENDNLIQGIPISRDPDDNDMRHLQIHNMLLLDKNLKPMLDMNPMLGMAMMAHMQEHLMYSQRAAAAMGGAPMPQGFGSGHGTSGMNMQALAPDPKEAGEIEAQMAAQGGA